MCCKTNPADTTEDASSAAWSGRAADSVWSVTFLAESYAKSGAVVEALRDPNMSIASTIFH